MSSACDRSFTAARAAAALLLAVAALVWANAAHAQGVPVFQIGPAVANRVAVFARNGQIIDGGIGTTALSDFDFSAASLSSLNSRYYVEYDSQLTGMRVRLSQSGTVADAAGTFRDAAYFENMDSDTGTYTQHHTNYAGRFAAFGPNPSGTGGGFQTTYKNIVGLSTYCKSANSGTVLAFGVMSGCSGITSEAIQFGAGIASNEFAAQNPSAAGGSSAQSKSMAAVQAIVASNYANADAGHTAYAFLASNSGSFRSTAAYGAAGGQYVAFLDAGSATVNTGGIIMPGSAANFVGTIIDYGIHNGNPAGGSWTDWLGSTNGGQYRWIDSGVVIAQLDTVGLIVHPVAGANGFTAAPVSGSGAIGYTLTGSWANGLNVAAATITDSAIVLNTSAAGSSIRYEANSWTDRQSAVNGGRYRWVDAGVVINTIDTKGQILHPVSGENGYTAEPVSGTGAIGFTLVGSWVNGLNLAAATITDAGIVLGTSALGSAIKYDANNYTQLNAGKYNVTVGGAIQASFGASGDVSLPGLIVTPGANQPVCINTTTMRLYFGAAGAC